MGWFIFLLILLVSAIAFFIAYPIIRIKIMPEKFNLFCERKIKKISKRNKLHFINNPRFENYGVKTDGIDQIIFGKKFVYIISDFCLIGEIKGSLDDASWRYKEYNEKTYKYVDNLINASNKNIEEFAGIMSINAEIIVSICVIPNECDLQVSGVNSSRANVVHLASVSRLIKSFEDKNIGDLNNEQLEQCYKALKERNE